MKRSPTLIASPAGQPARGHRAIVLGASLAGLLAARVLHQRFDEVLLLERDALPDGPMLRKGTPHTGHAHGLLARGRMVIEALFPGVTEALLAQGAQSGDLGANIAFHYGTRRFANAPVGLSGIAVSRPRLEAELRRRVRALPGVQLRAEVDVIEPEYDRVQRRVTGVRFSHRGEGSAQSLAADLVVDCTGRGSRSPAWLQAWGYAAVPEQRVQVGMGYVTAYFRREPQHAPGISAAICSATPELPRPGVLLAQEPADGDDAPRWVVTLGGYAGDHIPSTLEAMRERAASMASPELTRVVQRAEMLGTPTFRKVTHLVAPPASLLAPALVARVWWGSRGAPMKGSASVSAARTA